MATLKSGPLLGVRRPPAALAYRRFEAICTRKTEMCWDGPKRCQATALQGVAFVSGEVEQACEVVSGDLCRLFQTQLAKSSQAARYFHHKRGLISLAAIRHRRQKRTVSLKQQAVQRDGISYRP